MAQIMEDRVTAGVLLCQGVVSFTWLAAVRLGWCAGCRSGTVS